jgi:drug/metabolite transporter (DMT)-like permease
MINPTLVIAILAGLGGMLGWGFSEFATKKAVDKVGAISSLVWAHVFGTVLLFALLIIKIFTHSVSAPLHFSVGEWMGVIFFGTLQTVVYYFAYTAFEKGKVSILSPIFASFAGLVAVGSVILFGEVVHAGLAVALLVIFGGVLLINTDPETLRLRKFRLQGVSGLREILIATVLATIWTLGWDKFTADKDWLVYTMLMFVFMTFSAFLFAYMSKTKLLGMKKGAWGFLWLIAIGEVVAYLAITFGYSSTTHASVVAILSGASSLPTILLARAFIKERISTLQMIAAIIIIIGIILVTIV